MPSCEVDEADPLTKQDFSVSMLTVSHKHKALRTNFEDLALTSLPRCGIAETMIQSLIYGADGWTKFE